LIIDGNQGTVCPILKESTATQQMIRSVEHHPWFQSFAHGSALYRRPAVPRPRPSNTKQSKTRKCLCNQMRQMLLWPSKPAAVNSSVHRPMAPALQDAVIEGACSSPRASHRLPIRSPAFCGARATISLVYGSELLETPIPMRRLSRIQPPAEFF
jgi:hypothetical protein